MMQVGRDNLEILQAGSYSLEIDAVAGEELGSGTPPRQFVKELWGVGSLTLVMAAGTLVYKPPRGLLLFEHHVLAYYMTLAMIVVAGVVEVWTAFWLSEEARDGRSPCRRSRVFWRAVLWVSVVPLALVTGIGGYTVLVNMFN